MKHKKCLLIVCLSTFYFIAPAQEVHSTQFDWLVGTWQRMNVKSGRTAYEIWKRNASGEYKGKGFTLQGKDTVFVENLLIVLKGGTYFYVADVDHNATPVNFQILKYSGNSFTSENPTHDFPKVIRYWLIDDKLNAEISAGDKSFQFAFSKIE